MKYVGAFIAMLILSIFLWCLVIKMVTIRGNEKGVKEDWKLGVIAEPLGPGTYFIWRWTQSITKYDMSMRVFVMNNIPSDQDKVTQGRETDAYEVQSSEGQKLTISMTLQWQPDSEKIVEIHKSVREAIEEKVIRPALMRIVKDEATTRTAIIAYSGVGLVKLQSDIQSALLNTSRCDLKIKGVNVALFVIEKIKLDHDYELEIAAKQVAIQKNLRLMEEEKTAIQQKAKNTAEESAKAQVAVIAAERDKKVGITNAELGKQKAILDAEGENQRVVIAAKAQAEKLIAEAKGQMDADIMHAKAIEAIGKAEALAAKLKYEALQAQGSDNFVKMEVAKSMASAFQNVKGYLPNNMTFNTLATDYMRGVNSVMSVNPATAVAAPVYSH